jgi:hypothetical protein
MVVPKNLKPRFFMSLLIASDSGVLTCGPVIGGYGLAIGHKAIQVVIERAELLLHLDKQLRVVMAETFLSGCG